MARAHPKRARRGGRTWWSGEQGRAVAICALRYEKESSWREGMDVTAGSCMVERRGKRGGVLAVAARVWLAQE